VAEQSFAADTAASTAVRLLRQWPES